MTNTQLITLILAFFGIGLGGITSTHFTLRSSLTDFKEVVETKIDANMEVFKAEIKVQHQRLDAQGQRLDDQSQRLDAQSQRLDDLMTFLIPKRINSSKPKPKEKKHSIKKKI